MLSQSIKYLFFLKKNVALGFSPVLWVRVHTHDNQTQNYKFVLSHKELLRKGIEPRQSDA